MDWKQTVKTIYKAHAESLSLDNPSQRRTAENFSITPKRIHMILSLYPYLSDPEISSASGLHAAYLILLKRKREKKKEILENLLP